MRLVHYNRTLGQILLVAHRDCSLNWAIRDAAAIRCQKLATHTRALRESNFALRSKIGTIFYAGEIEANRNCWLSRIIADSLSGAEETFAATSGTVSAICISPSSSLSRPTWRERSSGGPPPLPPRSLLAISAQSRLG